ncbi:MAG TPA: Bax inhibitor-1/YccA family protein [Patescibacteria group bacterium]|nr:Bax inhibitor-1/YccA family protein [Patescibacteria group bacterium]
MANPIISKVQNIQSYSSDSASYAGVATKSILLLGIVTATALATWVMGYANPVTATVTGIMGFITAIAISFRPTWAGALSPLYAILEGMFLAAVSAMFAKMYQGIVINAVMITFGIAISSAFIYSRGYVKVNEGFMRAVYMATLGIAITYLIEFVLSFFGIRIPQIHQGGFIGIAFSLVVVGIATLNLFIDYENISQSVQQGLPKEYEWFCAFGLLVTLVWLYVEILSLLRKLRGN